MSATVVGTQGRVVLPREARDALDLQVGQRLTVTVRGRSLVLERADDAAEELRAFTRTLAPGRALVDELLAERRAAARDE